jgi:sortase (surface protein transpeptidase)
VKHRSRRRTVNLPWLTPGFVLTFGLILVLVVGYGLIVFVEPGRSSRAAQLVTLPYQETAAPTLSSPPSASASPTTSPAASLPTQLSIPTIGVASSLQSLGLLKDGTLQPPTSYGEAGWYAKGVIPGNVGPAVIAGHVDSVSGPGVFYRLRDLRVGDVVSIKRQNGSTLNFVVDDIHAYAKADFPTTVVYGPTALPELRLVTCTGDFDPAAHSYLSNLVVSAHLS